MQVWLLLLVLLLLVIGDKVSAQGQLGTRQNHVPWRAGHAGGLCVYADHHHHIHVYFSLC